MGNIQYQSECMKPRHRRPGPAIRRLWRLIHTGSFGACGAKDFNRFFNKMNVDALFDILDVVTVRYENDGLVKSIKVRHIKLVS